VADLASSLLKLSPQKRLYVQARLDGCNITAAAMAAGTDKKNGSRMEKDPEVQAAMVAAMTELAEDVQFSRKDAHEMLLSAYQNAATAAEQIAAVREMINLHGLAVPKKLEVEHNHKHSGQLEFMPTEELMKLAQMDDLTLEGEYEVISGELEHDG
jgi:phage terminase small subunit